MNARGTALMATAVAAAGCGGPAARVALVPLDGCKHAVGANAITVTAFTGGLEVKRSLQPDESVEIADFPDDTVQLGVEITVANGEVGVAGKTMPFVFSELRDGSELPIYMGALDGFCPTIGRMLNKRRTPAVVAAGDGALVVGGIGEGNRPLSTVEYYDRATSTFEAVDVPESLRDPLNGLVGAALTPLADGRVVVTGGPRFAVFDPATRSFGATFFLVPQRAFHGAVALDATHVLLSGGCPALVGAACAGDPVRSTIAYDLQAVAEEKTPLTPDAVSEGTQLFDTGSEYVLTGGFANPGEAQVFTLADTEAHKVVGLAGQATLIDGGAVFTAFAADGMPASPAAAVLAQGGGKVALRDGPGVANARIVTLEDGSVLVVGGDPGGIAGGVGRYVPTHDGWTTAAPAGMSPGTLATPAVVRLGDGTVLVLGGDAMPSDTAWIYRPSLVGPTSGSVIATPAIDTNPVVVTAPDPSKLVRGPNQWTLHATDDTLAARALVGGPRMRRGSVKATVGVSAGGFALIAQQIAPNHALVAHLIPGEKARLEQLASGQLCTGSLVDPFPPGKVTASLTVGAGVTTVALIDPATQAETTVLRCEVDAPDTGAWGVAASGTGSQVDVAAITVARAAR